MRNWLWSLLGVSVLGLVALPMLTHRSHSQDDDSPSAEATPIAPGACDDCGPPGDKTKAGPFCCQIEIIEEYPGPYYVYYGDYYENCPPTAAVEACYYYGSLESCPVFTCGPACGQGWGKRGPFPPFPGRNQREEPEYMHQLPDASADTSEVDDAFNDVFVETEIPGHKYFKIMKIDLVRRLSPARIARAQKLNEPPRKFGADSVYVAFEVTVIPPNWGRRVLPDDIWDVQRSRGKRVDPTHVYSAKFTFETTRAKPLQLLLAKDP